MFCATQDAELRHIYAACVLECLTSRSERDAILVSPLASFVTPVRSLQEVAVQDAVCLTNNSCMHVVDIDGHARIHERQFLHCFLRWASATPTSTCAALCRTQRRSGSPAAAPVLGAASTAAALRVHTAPWPALAVADHQVHMVCQMSQPVNLDLCDAYLHVECRCMRVSMHIAVRPPSWRRRACNRASGGCLGRHSARGRCLGAAGHLRAQEHQVLGTPSHHPRSAGDLCVSLSHPERFAARQNHVALAHVQMINIVAKQYHMLSAGGDRQAPARPGLRPPPQ